jgi:putative transposase
MLLINGADEYGEKDVIGIMDGFRENVDTGGTCFAAWKNEG